MATQTFLLSFLKRWGKTYKNRTRHITVERPIDSSSRSSSTRIYLQLHQQRLTKPVLI